MLIPFLLLQIAAPPPGPSSSGGFVPPTVTAVRVDAGVSLDGRLDEPAWALATRVTAFLQIDPDEGGAASESTEVRVLYDADAVYVGARLFDAAPRRIISRLARRDASTHSDEFRLFLDSYHDHRTAFEFIVNPAGVKKDVLLGGDGEFSDDSWDPVWQAATASDSLGWTVEIRIPFSQLRFSAAAEQVWGVRFARWIERKNELAMFPFVGKNENGVVSRFAHLVGLHDLVPPKRLELLPYAVARGTYHEPKALDNPFDGKASYFHNAGGDVKYGVTSSLTLDATVNPDFGQVELDPAKVNLTAFEDFFDEHRPFFVEGAEIFEFGGDGGGVTHFSGTPLFFYSRRIGREPQLEPTSRGDYTDMPAGTTILGAAKLSGRTATGWSMGLLEALTERERATVFDAASGARYSDPVEPLTNYFVGRMKHTSADGNTTIGALGTAANRRLDAPVFDQLPTAAYGGGVDFFHRWGRNTYSLAASVGGSYLAGDTLAIQRTQRSSNRDYTRPDAQAFRYDPTRTSLTGVTADLYLNKVAGTWRWGLAASTTTPGFDVNDLGFQKRVDLISAAAALGRRWTKPGPWFRQGYAYVTFGPSWNYDGDAIQRDLGGFGYAQLRNFWTVNWTAKYEMPVLDDRLTRGGPLAATPRAWYGSGTLTTDTRKDASGYAFLSYSGDDAGGWLVNVLPQLTLRPSAALFLSLGPGYLTGRSSAQYVTRVADSTAAATLGRRYVFAELRQRSAYVTVRANATFSPLLSFELYAQPFTFSGAYDRYKELRARRTYSFSEYGQGNGSTITPGDTTVCGSTGPDRCIGVDPDGAGPAAEFALYRPDFRTRSFKVKAVLRWEYRPGSTMFLVWTQSRSGYVPYDGTFDMQRDMATDLFRDRPTNVFLVKLNFWLSR